MTTRQYPKVAYVLKVYPRFSETFILNEILAHQEAGAPVAIYSLRRSDDQRFHEAIARVSSPVTHVPLAGSNKAAALWGGLRSAHRSGLHVDALIDSDEDIDTGDLEQALFLAGSVRERGIEHLHAHFGTVATAVARLAAKLAGISYSFTAHAKDIFHQGVEHEVLNRKLADAAAVVTVSEFNLRYLKKSFGHAADSVNLVYNGIDLEKFRFTVPASRRPLILGVGRLVEKKGFEYLIDACAELMAQGRAFTCEIAGPGVLADALQARIDARGLNGCVRLCGPLAQSEVRTKLLQASVLAAPCVISADADRDGLPTILLEAMALGTPCVSTDVTGIPEVLHHGQTGLCVAQRDAQDLAAACGELLADSDLGQRLASAARGLIEKNFDIRRNSDELRRVFKTAVATSDLATQGESQGPESGTMHTVICLNQDGGIDPARAKGAAVHLNSMRDAFRLIGANVIEIDCSDEAEVTRSINSLCTAQKVDLIYERYALGKHAAAGIAAALRIPLVIEVNAPLADEQKHWRGIAESAQDLCNDAALFNAAAAVIAVSNPVARYAARRGALKERIHVFGNGIDRERFNLAARRSSVRAELNLDDHFVVGFHGRERPWHGFERLVQLYASLRRDNRAVHLLVVGEGEFAALNTLPPSSYTRLGWQPHTKMPEYVAAFDALPLTYAENIPYYFSPLKLMEAMACGVVPVVPALGDLDATVSHDETGFVYAADNTHALTQHLLWLVDNPRGKVRMGRRAAAYAARFTWERIARFALQFASPPPPAEPRGDTPASRGRVVMQQALSALETRHAIPTGDRVLVRVDVGKGATLNFEAVNGHESRWFRYRDSHIEELLPANDAHVPLARSLNLVGSTQWRLLSYRPGRRLVVHHSDADHSAVIKGYRQNKLAAATSRHQLAHRLFAGTHLQVPALLYEDVREASMVTAHHAGVALPVSSDYEHLYALIGQSLRCVQDTSTIVSLDLHTAANEIGNLSKRAQRFHGVTDTLPPGWATTRQRLDNALKSLPADCYAPAHRDLHDRQFIVNDEKLTLLDFDLLCRADVTLDVANLLAHLSLRALQNIDGTTAADAHACGRALLDGLDRYAEPGFWPRLRFYEAATFLRLSLIYSLRPHWAALAGPLLSLGERCLNDYERLGA